MIVVVMPPGNQRFVYIYDPETGRRFNLDSLIIRLGTEAVAQKFKVTPSTVKKWRRQIHRPSRKSISHAFRRLI